MPISARLRLAAVILLAHPIRVGGYLLLVGLVLALSALAIAPFLTFTVALAWLAVAHFVLPVADVSERQQAVTCLADAIYYEAGFEPLSGQRAVAQVIINRVRDPNFPKSVCGVVFQGFQRKTGCQFSFVCDGSMKRRPPRPEQIGFARQIAQQALSGYVEKSVGTATHYHTDWVDPYWAPTLTKITQVGDHIFYRWPGKAGEPTSLRGYYQGGEVRTWQMAAIRILGHA